MTKVVPCLLVVFVLILAPGVEAEPATAPSTVGESTWPFGSDDCADGLVKDDGSLETGYGWVPSAVDGRYVQRFDVNEFGSRKVAEVCICWTHSRPDDEVSFKVQLYRDRAGRPARIPEASVEAVATLVPTFPDGAFYSVDVSEFDMNIPTTVFYLGVQWDPSEDEFFFVCADQSPTTPVVDGFFVDDRAEDWASVLESQDPIFADHRAMMIRAVPVEGYYALVPTMGTVGMVLLIGLIACLGAVLVSRRGR